MEKNKTQHYNYAFEAIPILFHGQTAKFMEMLEKDGLKFLKFWWDHVGDRLTEDLRTPFEGMGFEISDRGKDTKLAIITLPRPRKDEEAFYLACLAKPEKRFAWVRIPNTRVFVLRRADDIHEGSPTIFGELTPRAIFRRLDDGIEPNKAAFKKVVEKFLTRGK